MFVPEQSAPAVVPTTAVPFVDVVIVVVVVVLLLDFA